MNHFSCYAYGICNPTQQIQRKTVTQEGKISIPENSLQYNAKNTFCSQSSSHYVFRFSLQSCSCGSQAHNLQVKHMLFCVHLHWIANLHSHSVFHVIVKCFFKLVHTSSWKKKLPVCNRRQFQFLKLNLLVYSAENTQVNGEDNVHLIEPFFFPDTIDLQYKASSLLISAFLPLGCLLQSIAEVYTKYILTDNILN